MTLKESSQTQSPAILNHNLERAFPELLKFESTGEMEKSAVYREIKPEVEQVLNSVVQEDFAPPSADEKTIVNALAWNLERGIVFEGILDALQNHADLKDKDL